MSPSPQEGMGVAVIVKVEDGRRYFYKRIPAEKIRNRKNSRAWERT